MWVQWAPERRALDALAKLHPIHEAASTLDLRNLLDRNLR